MTRVVSMPAVVVLPAPFGPEEAEDLAPEDRQVEGVDRLEVGTRVDLGQVDGADHLVVGARRGGGRGARLSSCVVDISLLRQAVTGADQQLGERRRLLGGEQVAEFLVPHLGVGLDPVEMGPPGGCQLDVGDPAVGPVADPLDQAVGGQAIEVVGEGRPLDAERRRQLALADTGAMGHGAQHHVGVERRADGHQARSKCSRTTLPVMARIRPKRSSIDH